LVWCPWNRGEIRRSRIMQPSRLSCIMVIKESIRVESGSEQVRSPTGIVITNKLSLAAFIVLNVIDGILTKSLLAAGAYEFNPIMSLTGWAFWTVKLGITAIVTLGLLFFELRFPCRVKGILKGLVAGMVVICLFNLAALIYAGVPLSLSPEPNEPMINEPMINMGFLTATDIHTPEIALQNGITGYLDITLPSDSPSPLSVDRGGEINITILLHFVSYTPEVTEAQVNIDPNGHLEGAVQEGVNLVEFFSYNVSGNISITAGETIPVMMSIRIPENCPSGIEAISLCAVGITSNFLILDELGGIENEVAIH
jgi:hypothetical protein